MLDKTTAYGGGAKCIGPVDRIVAARIRAARLEAGISQTTLADGVGVTFQQVQKYEKGVNRVGANRLAQIADKVGKPITWFFEDAKQIASESGGDTITTMVQLLGSNRPIREIVMHLPRLNRDDAEIVASLVKRLTA
jgi:transcriptional regulator with XRE-family HTH domain